MNGVTFGSKHSYEDWGLILKSRPVISPPSPKTVYVDVPSADGNIDLTEWMCGEAKFENRTITCEFNVIEGRKRWSAVYSEILDFLHGKRMKVILDDDLSFYYMGRLKVNEWKSDKRTSTIVIEGNVEPYKMEKFSSLEDWEWDSFNFETDIIREYKDIQIQNVTYIHIEGRRKTIIPSFTVKTDDGKDFDVEFNGMIFSLPDGTSQFTNLVFKEGTNTLKIIGNGTMSIDYRGGRL